MNEKVVGVYKARLLAIVKEAVLLHKDFVAFADSGALTTEQFDLFGKITSTFLEEIMSQIDNVACNESTKEPVWEGTSEELDAALEATWTACEKEMECPVEESFGN